MAACTFMLTQILFTSWFLMAHCSQPNCTSVEDFYDCPGNTAGFCPESIVCACKDGKPFCKCPNFRGPWGDYWYMGEKCDQLWSTLDLVLVATLPGIALAIIVGVVIQIVHYCKRKPKKNGNHHGVEKSMSELRPQHNSAYGFGTDRNLPQPNQEENPWSLFNLEAFSATSFSPSSQLPRTNFNFFSQEHKEDSLYSSPYPNWNASPERSNPAVNFGDHHLSTMYTKPNFDFSISGVPRAAYPPKEKKYSVYEGSEIPYKIGRPNMISNY